MSKILEFPEPKGLTPKQRGLWLAQTNPEVLNHMARNLFKSESDLWDGDAHRVYDAMPESEQQEWRNKALQKLKDWAAEKPLTAEERMAERTAFARLLAKNDKKFQELMNAED